MRTRIGLYFAGLSIVAHLAGAVDCIKSNTFVGTCEQYQQYAKACGPYLQHADVHCGGMIASGIAGCTVPLTAVEFSPDRGTLKFEHINKNWCAVQDYTLVITLLSMDSAALLFVPSPDACYSGDCEAEAAAFNSNTIAHESEHQRIILQVIAEMNTQYARVAVSSCDGSEGALKTKKDATRQLETSAALRAVAFSGEFGRRSSFEPAERWLNCDKCKAGNSCNGTCCGSGETCQNGVCTTGARCLDGVCPADYYCWGVFDSIHPVCCAADQSLGLSCLCPSGYLLCPGTGLCFKGGC